MRMQNKRTGNAAWCIITVFLCGVLMGGMMVRLQLSEDAGLVRQLLVSRLVSLQETAVNPEALVQAGLQMLLPSLIFLGLSGVLGTWAVGQTPLLLLYLMLGLQIGGGSVLLFGADGVLFAILFYLPVMTGVFLTLLPMGVSGLMVSTGLFRQQKDELKKQFIGHLWLMLRQGILLLLFSAAAAALFGWYGADMMSKLTIG